ncbi:Type IV pilus biogenesis protein PilZ [hydrothermal vent metagenome]|uniref:Type IV pilus biogenesis protein PilZ n=1 Tax=hydrothermal vent metagenome TaxID=652676 RepID=A0A3B0YTD3_9ZZZZ
MTTTKDSPSSKAKQKGILSLTIKDKGALYAAYMPFIKGGGLFIPTNKEYKLGDEVFMLLKLMDETDKTPVVSIVVWKTPKAAQGNRITGIGVQFSQDAEGAAVRNKIDTYLAGMQNSDRLTHTM